MPVPPRMRAIVMEEYGPPAVLRLATWPSPAIGNDGLLIRVRSCGVCGHDALARRGLLRTPLPAVLGHEIAGDVVVIGPEVTKFRPGDRVALVQRIPCGQCKACGAGRTNLCVAGPGFYGEELPGGYAEYAWATERNAARLPEAVSYDAGAIASCALGTALRAVVRARVEDGERVLITASTGGVGIHAVQFAAARGAHVIALTASVDKVADLRAAGAHTVVVGQGNQIREELARLTGSTTVDAVLELAGRPSFANSFRALRHGGRMVLVGNLEPSDVALPLGLTILKELSVYGSSHATLADLETTLMALAQGTVRPVIAASMPLADAWVAHQRLADRRSTGRMVLNP